MGSPVVQWQMLSADPDKTAAFYTEVFGWTVRSDNPLGYRMIDTGSERGIPGGVWPAPPQTPAFVQLFVEVDDVQSAIDRATAAGARVLVPAQTLPEGDQMAILLDPQGMSFGLTRPRGR